MLKIDPVLFLFIVQFLIIFIFLSIFLVVRYRKLSVREAMAREEAGRLRAEAACSSEELSVRSAELDGLKKTNEDLQARFTHIKTINTKLKTAIEELAPEAERSKEFAKVIEKIEESNRELDNCIGSLQIENRTLEDKTRSLEHKADGLAELLQKSVGKEELERVQSRKKNLELKVRDLEDSVKEKSAEYDRIEKNYIWLEKEYNALYKNISDEQS